MARIIGKDRALRRLRGAAGQALIAEVGSAVMAAAQAIQVDAQHSITEGSVTGKGHVASLPGEPPNNQWGTLANNIEALHVEPLKATVTSKADHAAPLEFGTSKMAPRPYMAPAAARGRRKAAELVAAAVSRVIRKAGAV